MVFQNVSIFIFSLTVEFSKNRNNVLFPNNVIPALMGFAGIYAKFQVAGRQGQKGDVFLITEASIFLCWRIFRPMFPFSFTKNYRQVRFLSSLFVLGPGSCISRIIFPVFMSKHFPYSTTTSEYCCHTRWYDRC